MKRLSWLKPSWVLFCSSLSLFFFHFVVGERERERRRQKVKDAINSLAFLSTSPTVPKMLTIPAWCNICQRFEWLMVSTGRFYSGAWSQSGFAWLVMGKPWKVRCSSCCLLTLLLLRCNWAQLFGDVQKHFSKDMKQGCETTEEWNHKCKWTLALKTKNSKVRTSKLHWPEWETYFTALSRSSCLHEVSQ